MQDLKIGKAPRVARGLGGCGAAQTQVIRGASDATGLFSDGGPVPRVPPGLPVLVVDDVDLVRAALARVLARAGYEPILAENGYQALELIRTRKVAAAIVDHGLPGPDGVALLSALRRSQPNAVRVLISGALDLDTAVAAVNEGHVDHVLEKPLKVDEMLSRLAASLERNNASGEYSMSPQLDAEHKQLTECLHEGLLELALQPIVDAHTGLPRAYEALLRSSHATLRGPGEVIGAAERTGRVDEMTRLVAREAARWCERLPVETLLFVNLHPSDLEIPERLLESLSVLTPHGDRVVLEITERSALGERWRECLPLLRQQGFRVAVDDAGAGYSSLSTIAEAQPEVIKVDMSIVRDIHLHPPRRLLLKMLAAFADDSGVRLIAEGVETQEEAECIRDVGDVWMQGYYFGKPTQWNAWQHVD